MTDFGLIVLRAGKTDLILQYSNFRVFSACWEAIFGAPQLCLHLELPIQNVVQIFGATCENWGVAGDKICLLHRVAVFLSDIWT